MHLQITLLRHGRPDRSLSNKRPGCLSAKGRCQALERRVQLGSPTFDLVMHSELFRTEETARLIAGADENAKINAVTISELFYDEEDSRGKAVEQVFMRQGHASLHEYYKTARMEMQGLAEDARRALVEEINRQNATNILVIGHGMLLQSICIAFTRQDEPFMSKVLGECEGYRLTMEDGHVASIEALS